jgi:N-acetylglutamate synthase-like GNAT family acetyltransferase
MAEHGITVRRAKPGDAADIAALLNAAWEGQLEIDNIAVIERFGNVGFLLAERDGTLVGILGWQAENLIVRVTDFLVKSKSERFEVGGVLLAEMEQTARELQCEVTLLFFPYPATVEMVEFWDTLGYEPQGVAELPRAWQQAAQGDELEDRDTIWLKKLRDRRVLRPM